MMPIKEEPPLYGDVNNPASATKAWELVILKITKIRRPYQFSVYATMIEFGCEAGTKSHFA